MIKKFNYFILVLLPIIFIVSVLIDNKNVNKFWDGQILISRSISIEEEIIELKCYKGFISFNGKFMIRDIHLLNSDDYTRICSISPPFHLEKDSNSRAFVIYNDNIRHKILLK